MKSGRAEDPVEAGRVNAGKIVQFGINLIVAQEERIGVN